jgi:hypothetical protein
MTMTMTMTTDITEKITDYRASLTFLWSTQFKRRIRSPYDWSPLKDLTS